MLHIRLSLGNAAFGNSTLEAGDEVARILRRLANDAEEYGLDYVTDKKLMDTNGNSVGTVCHEGDGWPKPEHKEPPMTMHPPPIVSVYSIDPIKDLVKAFPDLKLTLERAEVHQPFNCSHRYVQLLVTGYKPWSSGRLLESAATLADIEKTLNTTLQEGSGWELKHILDLKNKVDLEFSWKAVLTVLTTAKDRVS